VVEGLCRDQGADAAAGGSVGQAFAGAEITEPGAYQGSGIRDQGSGIRDQGSGSGTGLGRILATTSLGRRGRRMRGRGLMGVAD
jgi:hypothetical protein